MLNIYENELNQSTNHDVCKVFKGTWKDKIHVMIFLPRAKKPFKNMAFSDASKAENTIQFIINKLQNQKNLNQEWKKQREERKLEEINTTNIGDIFVNSWGWEQTNIDFYQVVKKTAKRLYFRKIKSHMTKANHWAGGDFVPCQNDFSSDDIITSVKHGSFRKWDGAPQSATWDA